MTEIYCAQCNTPHPIGERCASAIFRRCQHGELITGNDKRSTHSGHCLACRRIVGRANGAKRRPA